jgi:hypothetical protein
MLARGDCPPGGAVLQFRFPFAQIRLPVKPAIMIKQKKTRAPSEGAADSTKKAQPPVHLSLSQPMDSEGCAGCESGSFKDSD